MAQVIHLEHDTVRVLLTGAFDAAAVETERTLLTKLAEVDDGHIILDFSDVDFVDSSGVGAVVFLYKRMVAAGRKLVLTGLSGQPRDLFRFLHIDTVIPVRDNAVTPHVTK